MIGQKSLKAVKETIEWRIIATTADTLIIYLFTGSLWKATSLGITLMLVKSIIYFAWKRIRNNL